MASWFIDEFHQLSSVRGLQSRMVLLSGNAISAMYPKQADRILCELHHVEETNVNALALLPHLHGVINETLRLVPSRMTGGGRPEGLWVDDTWIPGGSKVTASKYVLSRQLIHDKRAFAPYTVATLPGSRLTFPANPPSGNRQCVGKNLALVALRLVTAVLLKRYQVRFASDYDPETLMRNLKDQVTAQPGEC
ncbi:MAG: hypothetical protein M1816_004123 [Peltula sp. TS41687]|nr:MAG: hypothetical protein M1816_004123 [Peltula sp. TS41687]